jgi:hypothetical protein
LLLGVMMQDTFSIGRKRHHRQHSLLAGEDARCQPRRELTEQAVVRFLQIVELGLLARRPSTLYHMSVDQGLP